MELVRSGESQVAHLGDGLHSGVAGRALGHHQNPDGLDWTHFGLAGTRSPTADSGTGRLDRIEGVGLAVIAAGLAVRSIDLDNLQAPPPQEPGKAHPIGTGSLDADLAHLAELLEPGQQRLEAGGVRRERFGPHQPSQWIECRDNVGVEMGVDTTRDAGSSFYDGHCRPYFP
jgi:hypothetical protein